MKTKELVIIAVAVTALIAVTSATAYANMFTPWAYQYNRYAPTNQPSYGMMGGMMGSMMQGYPDQYNRGAPSQDSPRYSDGPGMIGGMMGGMMGGYGWAGDPDQGWGMPCHGGWDYKDNATQSDCAQVIIGNYNFHPQTLTVKVGTTVTWVNMDFVGHNVEAGIHDDQGHDHEDDLFESPILGHMGSFSYTFTELGEYVYHCDPHPYMEGRIIVVSE